MYPKMYMYKRIVEAKLFIDQNYAQAIDLDKIADSAHYSKYHFLRLFKQAFGKSPHQYLKDVRLDQAKLRLKSNLSITAVCFEVGFDSVSSFSLLFKKHTGLSPKEFRQKEQSQKEVMTKSPFQFIPNCFAESYHWKKIAIFNKFYSPESSTLS